MADFVKTCTLVQTDPILCLHRAEFMINFFGLDTRCVVRDRQCISFLKEMQIKAGSSLVITGHFLNLVQAFQQQEILQLHVNHLKTWEQVPNSLQLNPVETNEVERKDMLKSVLYEQTVQEKPEDTAFRIDTEQDIPLPTAKRRRLAHEDIMENHIETVMEIDSVDRDKETEGSVYREYKGSVDSYFLMLAGSIHLRNRIQDSEKQGLYSILDKMLHLYNFCLRPHCDEFVQLALRLQEAIKHHTDPQSAMPQLPKLPILPSSVFRLKMEDPRE